MFIIIYFFFSCAFYFVIFHFSLRLVLLLFVNVFHVRVRACCPRLTFIIVTTSCISQNKKKIITVFSVRHVSVCLRLFVLFHFLLFQICSHLILISVSCILCTVFSVYLFLSVCLIECRYEYVFYVLVKFEVRMREKVI